MKSSNTFIWYGIRVTTTNETFDERIGFTVVDLVPVDGEFPEFFYPAVTGVVKNILKPVTKISVTQ